MLLLERFVMEVLIGGKTVPVEIQRKRMKNMYLRVRPDGSIFVTCPYHVDERTVRDFVLSREAWILKVRLQQARTEVINREGVSGPIIYWLGEKKYVRYLEGSRDSCEIDGDILTFRLKEETDERIRRTFRKTAARALEAMIAEHRSEWDEKICMPAGIPYPEISVKYMTSRWGVCYPSKHRITLSTRLIHYPEVCMEAVLLHEYVHFLAPDHSDRFYRYVYRFMPDYDIYDKMLK
ncbi:MAG: M48 family metallopeptidase [Solobacterium sp.]|nr:M48 family metallopeptidase [Solobacterium sp.]